MLPRYPLPYAFARRHGLLLENDDGQLTLWHSGQPVWDAWGEVMRKYEVRHIALAEGGALHPCGHPPGRQVEFLGVRSSQATCAQGVAKRRAERNRAAVHRHQLEPQARAHREVARGKIGIVFIDRSTRKVALVPHAFMARVEAS